MQAGVVSIDLLMIAGFFKAMELQGRSDWTVWRGGEWGNVFFTGWVAIVRIAFLLGIGTGRNVANTKTA